MAMELKITAPAAHRVYQRNAQNTAAIGISVRIPELLGGRVEARASACAWITLGQTEGEQEQFAAELPAVPVGEHIIHMRIVAHEGGEVLAEGQAGPVYVGDLWVLAGQSNMEGCGKLVEVTEPQAGVSCFYMDDRWDIAQDPLSWAYESPDPIHWMHLPDGMETNEEQRRQFIADYRRDRVKGAGLGIPFGKMLLQHTGIPVGLIMTAHGGTSMSQWDAELACEGGRSLYGSMLRSVREAGGKVRGVLWYQGESDADEAASAVYYERMIRWVQSLRQDLGNPELPFIYAQLSTVTNWPAEAPWNRIQHDQLRLESVLGHAALVPAIDAVLADAIHPDTHSLRDIGHRMAWAALRLVHGQHAVQPGPRLEAVSWNEARTEITLTLTGVNGKLRQADRAFSFQVTSEEEVIPLFGHVDASRNAVVLKLERAAPAGACLWHGRGLNPGVNVRDELGIPLPVFGPLPL